MDSQVQKLPENGQEEDKDIKHYLKRFAECSSIQQLQKQDDGEAKKMLGKRQHHEDQETMIDSQDGSLEFSASEAIRAVMIKKPKRQE